MSQRRQVGFIKTFSSKNIHFQEEPSQFSYFKLRGARDDEQFSPYKFQDNQSKHKLNTLPSKTILAKPPLPERKTLKDKISTYLHGKAEAQQYYNKIKQRIASYQEKQSSSKQKLQENIGNIRNKIQRLDQVLKDLKSNKEPSVQKLERQPSAKKSKEKDYKSSSSSSSSSQEVIVTAIPSPKIPKESSKLSSKGRISAQKQQSSFRHTESKGVKFLDEERSHQQNSQQQSISSKSREKNGSNDNVITFNSRIKNQPPLYIKSYSSSSSSESQETQQLQEKRAQVRNVATRPNQERHQFFKNKGGVCFEVDVRQFTAPATTDRKQKERPARPPKKEKVDKKAEILRRRETAKAYDKMARRALFSPQY